MAVPFAPHKIATPFPKPPFDGDVIAAPEPQSPPSVILSQCSLLAKNLVLLLLTSVLYILFICHSCRGWHLLCRRGKVSKTREGGGTPQPPADLHNRPCAIRFGHGAKPPLRSESAHIRRDENLKNEIFQICRTNPVAQGAFMPAGITFDS